MTIHSPKKKKTVWRCVSDFKLLVLYLFNYVHGEMFRATDKYYCETIREIRPRVLRNW